MSEPNKSHGDAASWNAESITRFLAGIPLFSGCDASIITRIVPHLKQTHVESDAVLVRAGTPEPGLGILLSGRAAVRAVNATTGQVTSQEEIKPGDIFGEVGAVLSLAQPADVISIEPASAVMFPKEVFGQLATKVPGFGFALAKRVSMRVVQAGLANLRGNAGTVGVAKSAPSVEAPAKTPGAIAFVRASSYDITETLFALIPSKLILQAKALPLELKGRSLLVGMVDPFSLSATNELNRVLTGVTPEYAAISLDDFNELVLRYKIDPAGRSKGKQTPIESVVFDIADQEREADKAQRVIGDEVVQLATKIIAAAIDKGASDIHVEPEASSVRVRFRVGGSLNDLNQFIAPSFAKGLVARFKVLAGLDITERRLPQDGRIGLKIERREIDLRLSTMPVTRGEKMVLRLFEGANLMRPLEQIFHEPTTLQAVRAAIERPYGAIVVAGPTGSGKSSTLYGMLNERRRSRPDSNIVMVEDPIEYRLQGVTQVQVNHGVGLDFSKVLRGLLRQDPDVIMVGEIRDGDTALLSLEAAMTGHLLLTSIHGNNAMSILQRFEHLGASRAMLAQSLSLVLVQRLARKLCQECVGTEVPPPILVESLAKKGLIERSAGAVALPRSKGCNACGQTGFAGRIPIIESLSMTDELKDAMMGEQPLGEIERLAEEKHSLITFQRCCAFLMARGLMSPSEALLTVA